MVQPIDYAKLVGGFQSPQESFMNVLQVRQAVLKREKEAEETRLMKQDLEDYTSAPTPDKLANLQLRHKSLRDGLDAYTKTLSEANQGTTRDFAIKAFGLNLSGDTDGILNLFDQYVTAAGTSNLPEVARTMKDAKATFAKLETPEAREALIGSVLAGSGKDGLEIYKELFKQGKLTSFQQNLRAAGIDENSPEGIEKARQFVDLQIDPIVEMVTPNGEKFVGRESAYFNRFGTNAAAPKVKAPPRVGEVRNGYRFNGGDPAEKSNYTKVEKTGGQTVTPSGDFQGQ